MSARLVSTCYNYRGFGGLDWKPQSSWTIFNEVLSGRIVSRFTKGSFRREKMEITWNFTAIWWRDVQIFFSGPQRSTDGGKEGSAAVITHKIACLSFFMSPWSERRPTKCLPRRSRCSGYLTSQRESRSLQCNKQKSCDERKRILYSHNCMFFFLHSVSLML